MSVKDRIAAKKAAKASAAPVDVASAPAPATRSNRALRFGSVGQVDDVDLDQDAAPEVSLEPARVAPATITPPEAVTPTAPSVTPSRSTRFARPPPAVQIPAPRPSSPASGTPRQIRAEPPQDLTAWEDPDRPAGSGYSKEEWDAAEAASPNMIVFEMLKADERALVSKEKDANDVVLNRSLLVHELATCEWRSQASAIMEHHGQFGLSRYQVIRSQAERQKFPWADGAKLVIRDKGFEEPTAEQSRANRASSRSERFRA